MKTETKSKIARNIALTFLCLLLGVIIAFQYKTIDANNKISSDRAMTLEGLKSALIQEQIERRSLENELQILRDKNKRLEENALDQQSAILKEEYNRAMMLAGLRDVKGKGVIITIGDNALESVTDSDLLYVINILRSVDAQAISINDERLVAMTEIVNAEGYILVNGRAIYPPYTIKVIGDADSIEKAFYMNGGLYDYLTTMRMYASLEKKDEVYISKIREDSPSIKSNLLNPA